MEGATKLRDERQEKVSLELCVFAARAEMVVLGHAAVGDHREQCSG